VLPFALLNALRRASVPGLSAGGGRPRPGMARVTRVHAPREASWEFAESFVAEDAVFAAARSRADEVGCVPIGAGGGAALRFLAALTGARSVVEIGTGTGVSALWTLQGMRSDGVLTSIDVEGEHQRLARQALTEAAVPPNRVRLINGRALDVMSRLADGAYDLVFVDGDKSEYGAYFEEALRLLRPGGVVAFDNALWHDRVADPSQRDPETVALRGVVQAVREDERVLSLLLPVGDGLLAAIKRD
jgi:predicted O-methyltransferase YrrM